MQKTKLFQSIIAAIMLSFMLVPSVTTVLADATEGTWYSEGRKYLYGTMYNVFEKRTKETNEATFGFECYNVLPLCGWDTYSKMQVNVANYASTMSISDVYTIREKTGVVWLDVNEAYGRGDVVRLRIRGNDRTKDGYASFSYNPM